MNRFHRCRKCHIFRRIYERGLLSSETLVHTHGFAPLSSETPVHTHGFAPLSSETPVHTHGFAPLSSEPPVHTHRFTDVTDSQISQNTQISKIA